MKEQEMWLARDENENLYIHDTKPKKDTRRGIWTSLELYPLSYIYRQIPRSSMVR